MTLTRGAAQLWATLVLAFLLSSIAVTAGPSIPMDYCASINSGSTSANHSIYQSDGLCRDFCVAGNYALAVIKGDSCWCSNLLPAKSDQVSTSDCSDSCPGFPDDVCGGDGVWGYMKAKGNPTGTAGAGSTPAPSPSPTSSQQSESEETITATPSPTVQTVTADGTVMTVTVTPTPGVASETQSAAPDGSGRPSGLSTGAAVGVAVAVVVAIVAAGIITFCCWRKKKQREADALFAGGSPRSSSIGMMASSAKAAEAGMTPPLSDRNADGSWDHSLGRRRSMLMPIDPRIDPAHSGIYNREDNKSHDSINTLRDDQDYSRRVHHPSKVLRATNPDPDDDD